MHLSIIISEDGYIMLQERGYLTGYARRAWRHHLSAYRWMATQMVERIGRSPGRSSYPLWAWRSWNGKPRPDLRSGGHLPAGTKGYRLAIDVPDEEVLLSDFELWHHVLNGWYLALAEEDSDAFEAALKEARAPIYAPYPEPFHSRAVESWEHIFDVDRASSEWLGDASERSIQATFWRLDVEQVKSVQAFTAR